MDGFGERSQSVDLQKEKEAPKADEKPPEDPATGLVGNIFFRVV